jgi:formate dehydrogenase subunit gamma
MSRSISPAHSYEDPGMAKARSVEDVVVGEEVVRHRLSSRLIHWGVAFFFFAALLSGLPIWTPILGWMAALFGGLSVCRWLHPWLGGGFFVFTAVMFFHWVRDMRIEKHERGWLGPKMFRYLRHEAHDPDVGKYNGGQKLFFFLVAFLSLIVLLSGIVLWFPLSFGEMLREVSWLAHDAGFILFAVAVVFHIYLGTVAEPGTFRSMTRGTVTKGWARLHHPRWYREVTGERSDAPK